jgi:hypothetical protein
LVSLGGGEPNHWNSPPVTDHYSSQEVQKCLHANSVQWTFKPPRTLNFGGAHEPLVQSTKRALFNPLDQEKEDFRNPTEDVLRTLLYEMAGLLNTRPQVPIQLISVRWRRMISCTELQLLICQPGSIFMLSWGITKIIISVLLISSGISGKPSHLQSLVSRKKWKIRWPNFEVRDVVRVTRTSDEPSELLVM